MPLRQTVLWLHASELPRRCSTVTSSWCKVAVSSTLKSAPVSDASVEEQPVLPGSNRPWKADPQVHTEQSPDLAAGNINLEPSHEKPCLNFSVHMSLLVSFVVPTCGTVIIFHARSLRIGRVYCFVRVVARNVFGLLQIPESLLPSLVEKCV